MLSSPRRPSRGDEVSVCNHVFDFVPEIRESGPEHANGLEDPFRSPNWAERMMSDEACGDDFSGRRCVLGVEHLLEEASDQRFRFCVSHRNARFRDLVTGAIRVTPKLA
jgi:hypothetical protein